MSLHLQRSSLSDEKKTESKGTRTSRIKFKTLSPDEYQIESSESLKQTIHKRSATKKSSLSFSESFNEDISELLDPTNCFHPECSFAYTLTGDVKRPSLIAECIPHSTYQRLAALWGLDPNILPRQSGNTCKLRDQDEEENKIVEDFIKSVERDMGMQTDISEDLHVNPGTMEGSAVLHLKSKTELRHNAYIKFFKKMEALESKQAAKSNLGKKAGKITKMIIKKFLEWYQSLGGNDGETFIEESTLQELFQIGFEMPAAKALTIRIKEMPTVPESLALLRNEPKHATRYGLRKLLKHDIRMENIPSKMFAFGSMLPKEKPSLRYKPPRNFVKQTWMECSRVPNDLKTMKTVWQGLERLRSTIAFSNWLKDHPNIQPPIYLEEKGLLNINYEEWNQMFKGFEMDADNLEIIMPDMKLIQEKSSIQEPKLSETSSLKFDSYDSF